MFTSVVFKSVILLGVAVRVGVEMSHMRMAEDRSSRLQFSVRKCLLAS